MASLLLKLLAAQCPSDLVSSLFVIPCFYFSLNFSLFSSSVSLPLSFSIYFPPLVLFSTRFICGNSLLFFLFISLTDNQTVTQTSGLLMTCSVFLTSAFLASGLFLLHMSQNSVSLSHIHTLTQTQRQTHTHTHTRCGPNSSRDWRACVAPPVSLLAAGCNQS